MDLDRVVLTIIALTLQDRWLWGAVLIAVLAAMGLVLKREHHYFRGRNKAISWIALRLMSLLLLALALAVLILPAQAISGPEALAYFYLALFSLVPLVWFGGHVLCGRLLRPSFSRDESLALSASGLLILAIPAIALSYAHRPLSLAVQGLPEVAFEKAPAMPLPYVAEPPRRFKLDGVGIIVTQSLMAPPNISLERIELKTGGGWYDTKGLSMQLFCRDGQNIHLMWSAREQAPGLRLYWRVNGRRVHADFLPDAITFGNVPVQDFVVDFRKDGIDPPVPIPRNRASVAYFVSPEKLYFDQLNPLQPGETPDNDCIMRDYKRVAWEREGPLQGLALMFYLNGATLRADIMRSPPSGG